MEVSNYHPEPCPCLSRQVASSSSVVLPIWTLQPGLLAPAICDMPERGYASKGRLKQRCSCPIRQVFVGPFPDDEH